jgi:hypothetical protein
MPKRTVTCLYDSFEDAAQTVRDLEAAGVPENDMSMVVNNADDRYSQLAQPDDTGAKIGAETGAGIGGVIGGGAGLLAGLGLLAIPGVGPVVAAGWLAATAAGAAIGAGAGAATGGLLGAMTGAGVSSEHAHIYAEGVRRGGTLVTARVDETRVPEIDTIMHQYRAIDADERGRTYRDAGWEAFDERAGHDAPSDVSRDRNNLPL